MPKDFVFKKHTYKKGEYKSSVRYMKFPNAF